MAKTYLWSWDWNHFKRIILHAGLVRRTMLASGERVMGVMTMKDIQNLPGPMSNCVFPYTMGDWASRN